MARKGRPWRDFKPPPSGPVWAIIQGVGSYWTLGCGNRSRRVRRRRGARSHHDRAVGSAPRCLRAAPAARVRRARQLRVPRPDRRGVRADRDLRALPVHQWCRPRWPSWCGSLLGRCATGSCWPTRFEPAWWRHRSRTTLPRSTDRSCRRRSLPSCVPQVGLGLRLGWARRPGLRVLDLGAGRAPWAIAVLEQSPGSTAVVNDHAGRCRARRADACGARVGRPSRDPAGRLPSHRAGAAWIRHRRVGPRVPHRR